MADKKFNHITLKSEYKQRREVAKEVLMIARAQRGCAHGNWKTVAPSAPGHLAHVARIRGLVRG